MKKLFLIVGLISQSALAEISVETSRDLSSTSGTNNISLIYTLNAFENSETGAYGLSNHLGYAFSDSLAKVNLNSALNDFEIKGITNRLEYDVTFSEDLTFSFKFGRSAFNKDEARQDVLSGGFYYQVGDFRLGYMASNTDTYQVQQVVISGTDYTESLRYNRKSGSYSLGFNFTKDFSTALNYTQYQYDKNLDNSYALLTTLPLLNRAGGAVANDVGSQLKNSLDFSVTYFLTRGLLVTFGLGAAQEALNPGVRSNDISLGLDYEILIDDVSYRLFGLFDVVKTEDVDGTSNSGQFGIGFSF